MYRAAARRVCRCHGMDRDEAQQPPPTCRLPHRAIATGVGWLLSFRFRTPPARAPGAATLRPGLRRGAQVYGAEDRSVQDRLPHERAQTRLTARGAVEVSVSPDTGHAKNRFESPDSCAPTGQLCRAPPARDDRFDMEQKGVL